MAHAEGDSPDQRLTASQWALLLVLAAVQVTHIVDFMILMPLAPQLQTDLHISIQQFGIVISAYGFSAGLCGLLLASALDRFDRKTSLLVLYAGFTLGTAVCAIAPNYATLFAGRVLAGGFGGVAASVVLAIVGDAFPPSRRGTAMGVVMSGFSVASIAGVPAGLLFAHNSSLGWRAPFAALAVASVGLLLFACISLPAVRGHLSEFRLPVTLLDIVTRPAHVRAYLLITTLVFSSFMVAPYIAAYLVKNVGIEESQLYLVYLTGGAATLVSMNLIGRLADRFARLPLFRILSVLALVTIVGLTNLPPGSSIVLTLFATTCMMIFTSGRMVPGMAMITSVALPRDRGSFLSVNASMQQLAAGMAPLLSVLVLGDTKGDAPLVGFPLVGLLAAGSGLVSLYFAGLLTSAEGEAGDRPDNAPVPDHEIVPDPIVDERIATGGTPVPRIQTITDFSDLNA